MNGYTLIRNWYDFKFVNSNVKAIHSDLYCYIVDKWNRLGQKESFGLPTSMTMEVLNIGSYNTYKKTLSDLVDFGVLIIVSDSKNQHVSKVVALSKFDKPSDKALDKATAIARDEPTDKAIDTIDEYLNKFKNLNKEQINKILAHANKLPSNELILFVSSFEPEKPKAFDFKKELINNGAELKLINEWLLIRKKKNLTNTESALETFLIEVSKTGKPINEVLKKCSSDGWGGFKASWNWDTNNNNSHQNGQQPKSFDRNRG